MELERGVDCPGVEYHYDKMTALYISSGGKYESKGGTLCAIKYTQIRT